MTPTPIFSILKFFSKMSEIGRFFNTRTFKWIFVWETGQSWAPAVFATRKHIKKPISAHRGFYVGDLQPELSEDFQNLRWRKVVKKGDFGGVKKWCFFDIFSYASKNLKNLKISEVFFHDFEHFCFWSCMVFRNIQRDKPRKPSFFVISRDRETFFFLPLFYK